MATIGREAPAARIGILLPFRVLAVLVAALILVQAALAGQWLFQGQTGAISIHGWLGNTSFLGAILLVILAVVGIRQSGGAWGRAELVLGIVLVLLMTAQLGLGYSGRASAAAASLHIPNGVLLTMVTAALLALAWRPAGLPSARG